MGIKTNYLTPILVVGFIIAAIANHFFDPFETFIGHYDLWEGMFGEEEAVIADTVFSFVFPALPALAEVLTYLQIAGSDMMSSNMLAMEIIFLLYGILVFSMERFHSELHNEEGIFTVCVNMLCIEKIVMYIFSIIAAFIFLFITSLNLSFWLLVILIAPLLLPTLCILLIFTFYWGIAALIILLPTVLIVNHMRSMNIVFMNIMTLILMTLLSQVVWRSVSDTVLKKVCYCCSLGRIDLE